MGSEMCIRDRAVLASTAASSAVPPAPQAAAAAPQAGQQQPARRQNKKPRQSDQRHPSANRRQGDQRPPSAPRQQGDQRPPSAPRQHGDQRPQSASRRGGGPPLVPSFGDSPDFRNPGAFTPPPGRFYDQPYHPGYGRDFFQGRDFHPGFFHGYPPPQGFPPQVVLGQYPLPSDQQLGRMSSFPSSGPSSGGRQPEDAGPIAARVRQHHHSVTRQSPRRRNSGGGLEDPCPYCGLYLDADGACDCSAPGPLI